MVDGVVTKLEMLLKHVPEQFRSFSHEEIITPHSPGKWSRLQIVGHLCDSAVNNLTRFIQAQYQPEPLALVPYDQDVWVAAQNYLDAATEEVLTLWVSLNRSVIRVISNLPIEKHAHKCVLPSGEVASLEWLIHDYLEHMEHHLRQIFPE